MERWRLLQQHKDVQMNRYASIVQMNCFRAGRINKNVLNALEIQSGIQCKVSSFTGYVGITKKGY